MKHLLSFFALSLFLFSCTEVMEIDPNSSSAITGKYKTMEVVGDYIYAITNTELVTIDKSDNENLQEIDRHHLGGRLENLHVTEEAIFIGSVTNVHIFALEDNGLPALRSSTEHIEWPDDFIPCPNTGGWGGFDPVIASQDIAYVTLSTVDPAGPNNCGLQRAVNELNIYDAHDISAPIKLFTLEMDSPQGLAIDGDLLFITNLEADTEVFRVDHEGGIEHEATIEGAAHDVIAIDGKVMIVSKTEINQYDYSNVQDIVHYGTIAL